MHQTALLQDIFDLEQNLHWIYKLRNTNYATKTSTVLIVLVFVHFRVRHPTRDHLPIQGNIGTNIHAIFAGGDHTNGHITGLSSPGAFADQHITS
jgi:hypothetical protein